MKKTLLLGMLLAAGFGANAQLANGSIAPDFTATDIEGNVFNLYDLLDEGKTVIIDVSATWCGPCWNFHNTHALDKLNKSYGDLGTQQVVVLYVEGDPQTTIGNLNGLDDNPDYAPTQGNWVEGTTYHFIHEGGAEIGDLLEITSFPTVYSICPDKTVYYFDPTIPGELNFDNIVDVVNADCGALTAPENHAEIHGAAVRMCEDGDAVTFDATISNYGENNITSATVVLKKDGAEVVATSEFAGNLAPYANAAAVEFENVVFDTDSEYTVHVDAVNAGTAFNEEMTEAEITTSVATTGTNNMLDIVVFTDNYPSEISWKIEDASGTVVAEGGDYPPGTDDQWGGGGDYANIEIHHYVAVPAGDAQCYTVIMEDEFNDGWMYGATNHGMEVYSAGELIFQKFVANFGSELVNPAAFRTLGTLGNEEFTSSSFAIYPNPSTGIFNFTTQETVKVTVMDLTGKVVFTAADINDGGTINLSNLSSGMYVAKVSGASFEKVEKLVIK